MTNPHFSLIRIVIAKYTLQSYVDEKTGSYIKVYGALGVGFRVYVGLRVKGFGNGNHYRV